MYTHVCIETASKYNDKYSPIIKRGDFCTLISTTNRLTLETSVGYEFEEHKNYYYSSNLFVELPPQKTVYVAVSEDIVKEIEEPVLN